MSVRVFYEILNQRGTPAMFTDTLANRPAFGFAGRLFVSTDSGQIFEDTGSAWTLVADAGVGGGTLSSVCLNGNTTATGIVITSGGLSTNSLTDTALTAGSILYAGSGGLISQSNSTFFWDATNNRLGIGINAPGAPLDIHATGTNAQFNGTGTNNAYLQFQNAGVSKWRIGNTYNGAANSFDIYNNGLANTALSFNSTTNAATFNNSITGTSIIKSGGTSTQFLKADGSVDSNTYLTTSSASSSYVPYTGATGAVNLGSYNLTVNSIIVGTASGSGSNNVVLGTGMPNNTTGLSNTSIGNSALGSNTIGSYCTAIGQGALQALTTGGLNTALGQGSLSSLIGGSNNTAIGQGALNLAISSFNTALGQSAGAIVSTGSYNTLIGYQAGNTITTGSYNTIIGNYIGTAALSNNIVLADGQSNIRYQWDGTANTFTGFVKVNSVPISTYGLQVNNSLGNPAFVAYQNSDSSYALQMATTGATTISINANASNSYFNTAGNFGFGNNSPAYKLDVSGSIRTTSTINLTGTNSQILTTISNSIAADNVCVLYNTSSTGYGLYIGAGGSTTNALYCTDYTRAKNLFLVRGDGEVLVGTATNTINSSNFGIRLAPDGTFQNSRNAGGGAGVMNVFGNAGQMLVYGNGNIQNTNGSYGTISDSRLKDNIIDSTSKLEDLLKVRIVNYNLKKYPDQKLLGVVAQELEQIFPALIEINEQGYKGVKYSIFVPILIKAVQELNEKLVKNNIN